MSARFIEIMPASFVGDQVLSEQFVNAMHRQIEVNGGPSYGPTDLAQRQKSLNNFVVLMQHGFWEAWRLETEKSPVSALLLVKQGFTKTGHQIMRFEDIVTQPKLDWNQYASLALLSGAAAGIQKYGQNVVITGEADDDTLKPHANKLYRKIGGIQTDLVAARFCHDELKAFRALPIDPALTMGTRLIINSIQGITSVDLNAQTSAEAKEALERIQRDLPVSYHIILSSRGDVIAEAAKQDRASIIRTANYDFDADPAAETNESPVGSQIDEFDCTDLASAAASFRVIGEIMTAPQISRVDGRFTLVQSFADVAVDTRNPAHQSVIDAYGLPFNNYATAGDEAAASGVSRIYWNERPQLPQGFKPAELVFAS